jgi:hypothetical protein
VCVCVCVFVFLATSVNLVANGKHSVQGQRMGQDVCGEKREWLGMVPLSWQVLGPSRGAGRIRRFQPRFDSPRHILVLRWLAAAAFSCQGML